MYRFVFGFNFLTSVRSNRVSPNIRVQIKEDISRAEQMDSHMEGVLPRGCLDMSYGLNDEHEYAQVISFDYFVLNL